MFFTVHGFLANKGADFPQQGFVFHPFFCIPYRVNKKLLTFRKIGLKRRPHVAAGWVVIDKVSVEVGKIEIHSAYRKARTFLMNRNGCAHNDLHRVLCIITINDVDSC